MGSEEGDGGVGSTESLLVSPSSSSSMKGFFFYVYMVHRPLESESQLTA